LLADRCGECDRARLLYLGVKTPRGLFQVITCITSYIEVQKLVGLVDVEAILERSDFGGGCRGRDSVS